MELTTLLDKVLEYFAENYPKRQNYLLSQIEKDIWLTRDINNNSVKIETYTRLRASDYIEIIKPRSFHQDEYGSLVYAGINDGEIKINTEGKIYLIWLEAEFSKEELQEKLHTVSISSMSLNKVLSRYAFAIAIISAVVPFIIYGISQNDQVKVDTKTKEVTRLLEVLDSSRKEQKSFQDSVLKVLSDTSR